MTINGANHDEQEMAEAAILRQRPITPEQLQKFEGYVAEIFTARGLDPNAPATRETPSRFIKAMLEVTSGYEGDPKLLKVFQTECHGAPDCRVNGSSTMPH